MKLPSSALLAATLLLRSCLVQANIPLHAPSELQPKAVDPRNHYYLDPPQLPASSSNLTTSTPVFRGNRSAPRVHAAVPTTSSGALACSASTPCIDGSCCGPKNTCGFGPDYCGSGCQNNCNATAPCGRYSLDGNVACGMNLCCSYYGWCGVTADYCTPPPKAGLPGCQTSYSDCQVHPPLQCDPGAASATKRTIGYYQGGNVYSADRQCNRVYPQDLKVDNYTHLYWAFAEIDPRSYQITPSNVQDLDLYSNFTALKSNNKLETWISIGGFDFTTANPNAWSDMVASAQNRATFINSLVAFMNKYGFQGVDLDWEYPVDKNRGGSPADMTNLVQLLADMRANSAFGQNFGISVTLAPDIWYLQHFDAKGLLQHASWLGFMSYDLHGTWDANVPRVGKHVYGQTDIYDISNDLNPLWFDLDAADMSRVNFGLALYGRGYTLADPSCNKADGSCGWTSGSKAAACTTTEGLMSAAEIAAVMQQNSLTATKLDSGHGDSFMKQITWDDQWMGFDDEETIQQKINYASSHCFGGTMAWSVDLGANFDTSQDPGNTGHGVVPHPQAGCRWTDCAFPATCGSSEVEITTRYSDSCPLTGPQQVQAYCCLEDTPLNNCVWRGDEVNPCDDSTGLCPDCINTQCLPGELLVATDKYGDQEDTCPPAAAQNPNGPQRSLCCRDSAPVIGSDDSFIMPAQCDGTLSSYPYTADCQSSIQSYLTETLEDACQNSNPGSDGCTYIANGICPFLLCGANQGTPYNCEMIGVALQELVSSCQLPSGKVGGAVVLRSSGNGGTANQTVQLTDTTGLRKALSEKNPTNHNPSAKREISRRDLAMPPDWTFTSDFPFQYSFAGKMGIPNAVVTQGDVDLQKLNLADEALAVEGDETLISVDVPLASGAGSLEIKFLLTNGNGIGTFTADQLTTLAQGANDYRNWQENPSVFASSLKRKPGTRPEDYVGAMVLQINKRSKTGNGTQPPDLATCGADLCALGTIVCNEEPYADSRGPSGSPNRRDGLSNPADELFNISSLALAGKKRDPDPPVSGGSRPFSAYCRGGRGGNNGGLSWQSARYPTISDWTVDDERYDHAYDASDYTNCASTGIGGHIMPVQPPRYYCTEHILELQTIKMFLNDTSLNRLPDGTAAPTNEVDCAFVEALGTALLAGTNPPLTPGSTVSDDVPIHRIMEVLGSANNWQDFVFLERGINYYKSVFWRGVNPVGSGNIGAINGDRYSEGLINIRSTFNFFNYLRDPAVNQILIDTCNGVRAELVRANAAFMSAGNADTNVVAYWDAWIRNFFAVVNNRGSLWATANMAAMRANWIPKHPSAAKDLVLGTLFTFGNAQWQLSFPTTGLD